MDWEPQEHESQADGRPVQPQARNVLPFRARKKALPATADFEALLASATQNSSQNLTPDLTHDGNSPRRKRRRAPVQTEPQNNPVPEALLPYGTQPSLGRSLSRQHPSHKHALPLGGVVALFSNCSHPDHVEAWAEVDREQLMWENFQLFKRQTQCVVALQGYYRNDARRQDLLQQIAQMNKQVAEEAVDSLQADTFHFKKHMLATDAKFPPEYLRADSALWSLLSINRTLLTLSLAAETLSNGKGYAPLAKTRLDELLQMKTMLYDELNQSERVLFKKCRRPGLRILCMLQARLFGWV